MNPQYRDAYLETLAKVLPSCKKHKGSRFFWESRARFSTAGGRPHASSVRGHSGSVMDSPKYTTNTSLPNNHYTNQRNVGRLSAIIEKRSSGIEDGIREGSETSKPLVYSGDGIKVGTSVIVENEANLLSSNTTQ